MIVDILLGSCLIIGVGIQARIMYEVVMMPDVSPINDTVVTVFGVVTVAAMAAYTLSRAVDLTWQMIGGK